MANTILVLPLHAKSKQTPLMISSRTGHIDKVKELIASGIDINERDGKSGLTPLLFAINSKDLEIVKLLLDSGADVNQADNNDFTH